MHFRIKWVLLCYAAFGRVVRPSGDVKSMEKLAEIKAADLHRIDTINLMLYTLLLICTVLTIWMFKRKRLRFVHETGLTLIYGLCIGLLLRFTSTNSSFHELMVKPSNASLTEIATPPDYLRIRINMDNHNNTWYKYRFDGLDIRNSEALIEQKATFDPEIFFNLILPPIIFNAGYSLKKRHFFRNIGSILMFAIIGTTLSCFLTGFFMYAIMFLSNTRLSLNDSLFFGAIISATDPVTVLAIFNDLNVDVDLFALVFGESALNDAVAIVLSSTIERFVRPLGSAPPSLDFMSVSYSACAFLVVFFGSLAFGIICGCGAAFLTKFTKIAEFPLLETSLFVLCSYLSFLMAEASGMTGVVAVLFCGICQAHYTYNNLSEESQKRTKQLFEILTFLSENFIFTYIGVSMFTSTWHSFNPLFIIGGFIMAFFARAAFIYPLSALLNLFRRPKIPPNHQHMLLVAGLRGAVAFALAIRNTSTPERRIIYSTTSLIVIFTVLVNGGLAAQFIQWLGIRCADSSCDAINSQPTNIDDGHSQSKNTGPRRYNPWDKSFLPRKWYNFDSRFLKPLLTNSRPTLMETLPTCCLPIARLLTTTQQMAQGVGLGENEIVIDNENNEHTVLNDDRFAYQSFTPASLDFQDNSESNATCNLPMSSNRQNQRLEDSDHTFKQVV